MCIHWVTTESALRNCGTRVKSVGVRIAVCILALTPGRIFAFTSDLAKIKPGIDCMLENMLPSLINRAHEVSLAFQLSSCSKHV